MYTQHALTLSHVVFCDIAGTASWEPLSASSSVSVPAPSAVVGSITCWRCSSSPSPSSSDPVLVSAVGKVDGVGVGHAVAVGGDAVVGGVDEGGVGSEGGGGRGDDDAEEEEKAEEGAKIRTVSNHLPPSPPPPSQPLFACATLISARDHS